MVRCLPVFVDFSDALPLVDFPFSTCLSDLADLVLLAASEAPLVDSASLILRFAACIKSNIDEIEITL